MTTQNRKVRSGNTIQVLFDGVVVGAVKSVRLNDEYSPEPATGIGDIHVIEYVPSLARHTLNCQYVVLNTKTLRQLGLGMLNGDDVLQGLVFDFQAISNVDNSVIRKYTGCSYASGDVDITANAIVMASAVFMALDVTGQGA